MDRSHQTPGMTGRTDFPGPGARIWRPTPVLLIGLGVLAALAAVGATLPRDPQDRAVTALVGVVLLATVLFGWRRRLVGGPRGLLIGGVTGARIVPWSMVATIGCGRTKRMGSATLEIDLLDDELMVFSRLELGADPAAVEAVLAGWFDTRHAGPGVSGPARS